MNRFRITFHLGLGNSRDKPELIDATKAELAAVYGGYTWLESSGGWLSPSGVLEYEPGAVIVVYAEDPSQSSNTAEGLRRAFNQVEVWYTVEPITVCVSSTAL